MAAGAILERDVLVPELALRTRVLEAGDGPVVLLLHGNPDNADEWRPLMLRLAARFRCLAPDFPGYGRAQLPASFGYTLNELVRFVDGVSRAMRVADPITLVVHDNGVGFDVQAASGLGLISMRERTCLLRGEFAIYSAPGMGTTVRARVPLTMPETPLAEDACTRRVG